MEAIAFYLRRFHVIPENEAVYGQGFTEWSNVRSAKPLFKGHHQPRIPHNILGYYNLLDEKTLILQHYLAYSNGIHGFCYYYYNMAGRRLLEKPLDIINASRDINNDFCLCWDHNSWYDNTRTERDIPFIQQIYSVENAKGIIQDLEQYFSNPRYIKIDGKPLFLVFAPERCPGIEMYAETWREEASRLGFPGVYLAGVEAFIGCPPSMFGFDCMVEYAPNWRTENMVCGMENPPRRLDYRETVKFMLAKQVPDYPEMRCVFPDWDNTPRRGKNGIATVNVSPEVFRIALEGMADFTRRFVPDSLQYLFINAWNEWGEGCHLEPDQRYGFTYLSIVNEVMKQYGG